ncbi:MAG: hypothetical protein E7186_03560 [Erysipelotrichaceae bacterium]|nr:hypothetical protein [Erysipelotrichaceae bacterium]
MKKFLQKYSDFMSGRYGVDDLFYFLMISVLILGLFPNFLLRNGLGLIRWTLFGLGIFRYLSRNFPARSRENARFMKFFRPVKKEFRFLFTRIRNIKTYRYRRCPKCHQQLRLPVNKGKHTVVCPTCKHEFEVNIRF